MRMQCWVKEVVCLPQSVAASLTPLTGSRWRPGKAGKLGRCEGGAAAKARGVVEGDLFGGGVDRGR